MNVIFTASLFITGGTSAGPAKAEWGPELPALARRNRLFLWEDVSAVEVLRIPAQIRAFFEGNRFSGTAVSTPAQAIAERNLTLDETALVGASPKAREAARAASIPCFYLQAGPAPEGESSENVFASVDEVVNAIWKVNTVERHLFPVVTVGGLLIDEGGDVLLVRTRKWSGKWGIPGGKVDYGETLKNAFRRETFEETGLEVLEARLILTQEAVEHPEFFRKRHFVLVNFLGRVGGRHPAVTLNHEGAEYFWGAPEEALNDKGGGAQRPLNDPTRVLIKQYLIIKGEKLWAS
jgi:ADP-ribose pyrophosphatase YjhB (NUDIX family)